MSRIGGFEDDLGQGGFDDLMAPAAIASSSAYPAQTYSDNSTLLSDNPFADMESSQYIVPIATPSYHSGPAAVEEGDETAPHDTSGFMDHAQDNYQDSGSSSSRYRREDAPEPETPSTTYAEVAPASFPSPTLHHRKAQQTPAELALLLGEESPILPTYRANFKPSLHLQQSQASKGDHVLPISSIGKRAVGGPLAALLGLEEDTPAVPAAASVAAVHISSKPADAPPASTSSRTPSLTPTEASIPANDSYSSMVSPMPESPRSPTQAEAKAVQTSKDQVDDLASTLQDLGVKDEPREEDSMGKRENGQSVEAAVAVTPSAIVTTFTRSPLQSPFAREQDHPTEPASDVPALAPSTTTSFNLNPASTISPGFRSFNADSESGSHEDVFASVYHQPTSAVVEPGRNGDAYQNEGFMQHAEVEAGETRIPTGQVLPLPPPPASEAASSATLRPTEDATSILAPTFLIAVGDPQKVGSSLNVAAQHTVYTVRTKTTSAAFRKPEFSVLRRFSHFLWLFDALSHNNPGVIVPGMPEKSTLGRFGSDFVENRRSALQAALMKIVSHPMLVGDPDLRFFLESDTFANDIKQRKVDTPLESKGFLASLGSSISGPKFQETDEYFNTRRQTLDAFENQLKLLLTSLTNSIKVRASLQTSVSELQSAFIALSTCDLSGPLKTALERAAGLQKRLRELSEEQSASEEAAGGLMGVAEGYSRLCGSVKLVFAARIKAFNTWQAAEANLRKVRLAHDKAKRAGKTHSELLGLSLSEIAEAERRTIDTQQDFVDVAKLVKAEMIRFDKEKVEDFKKAVEDYVDAMLLRQREVVLAWQTYQEFLLEAAGSNVAAPSESGHPLGA